MIYKCRKNKTFRSLCAIIALCIFMPSLASCTALLSINNGLSISDYFYSGKGSLYHSFSKNNRKIAETEHTELYFDEESMSVAVFDTRGGNSFYSLPCSASSASVLKLTAIGENGTFELNSQDNSVAYDTADYELTDYGIKVNYRLSNDAVTAKKNNNTLLDGELLIALSVTYTLANDSLFTQIDCSDIFVSGGYNITQLSVLDSFGAIYESSVDFLADSHEPATAATAEATTETESDADREDIRQETTQEENQQEDLENDNSNEASARDFILLPDGCGAILYTDSSAAPEELSFKVYGADAGIGEKDLLSASFPAYGIKSGDSAFVSVIDGGAAVATVKAETAAGGEADRVGASFQLTPMQISSDEAFFAAAYKGDILICSKFLSGKEATYIGMAASCRDEFIRTGILSGQQLSQDEMSLNIAVLVSSDGSKSGTVSTFSQAEDTLALLKAKGVDDLNLILRGALDGGLIRDDINSFSLLSGAGGKSDFESLYSYAQKQKFDLYIGCGIITQSGLSGSTAKTADGSKSTVKIENSLYPYYSTKTFSASLAALQKTESNIIDLINSAKGSSFDGYCVSDAAKILYSDTGFNRANAASIISLCADSLATQRNLMLEGSNFYCLRKAESLIDIPFETQLEASEYYVAVPFLQAMLHSTLTYSGSPINTAAIPTLLMLKYIEYGASLYFQWSFDSSNTLLYYDNSLSDAVEWYNNAESKLSDLADDRIVSHFRVVDNVYCTGYDCGSLIYVNYNNYSVNVGNISIPAYSFFRVN